MKFAKKCGIFIHARSLLMYIFIAALTASTLYFGVHSGMNAWLLIGGAAAVMVVLSFLFRLVDAHRLMLFIKQTDKK